MVLTYMQRRPSGIYEFRQHLPRAIAGKVAPEFVRQQVPELVNDKTGRFKRELTKSLDTKDYKKARRNDLREAGRVGALFDFAVELFHGGAPEAIQHLLPSLQKIETDALREVLEADEGSRRDGDARKQLQSSAERAQWPDLEKVHFGTRGMEESHTFVLEEEINLLLGDFKRAYARRDPTIIQAELHVYLARHGVPIDPKSDYHYEAGLALLRGTVRGYELRKQRSEGREVSTPPPAKSESNGPKLSEAFSEWKAGSSARGGKKAAATSIVEAERAVRYFTQYHGNLYIAEISKEKARAFRTALSSIPKRITNKQRALPLRTLLKETAGAAETIHATSVNKYLTLMGAVISAAEREGKLDHLPGFRNPFHGLALAVDKRNDTTRREPFSDEELSALFSTGVFTDQERPAGGSGEAAYWLPLIALLSGARLSEISQLRIRDLKRNSETGIWFIDIGNEGGRSIKTDGSRRQVPVHAELIRLGLLRYREDLVEPGAKDTSSLWPDITVNPGDTTPKAWSKWFNRYLRETAGIEDRSIVFHSFRHAFKRLARNAHLGEELHDALTGHAGTGSVGRGYGSGFSLKALHDAIGRIDAPQSVKALPEWKPPDHMEVIKWRKR
ncbi:Lambda integrase-like/DNA breaking-rejoining enzyme, catalytic CorE [Neorhizobium galegae bv. officinalis]|uniref:Lambda integrase-like/DNA breaking-rejoining enzyme, catalytic CorE n=1 Tax=Neorhizobium galegae bv. officinalis TaxID=323656 RepID=A0A0T7G338_NEOGA|nr:site-specific integrase [Neorhizobium galegae]CDZ41607.1 Lambda integrase-like/DNA breaking-rejoining enzyme, catalytic CorE [Neorhizobium galegae bv. officinalis]